MDPTSSFDPYNWSTITPTLTALSEADVAPGGFTDWLERWNAFDIAIEDAWTQLKRRSYTDTGNAAAEADYRHYTREVFSTYLGLTRKLSARALALQPTPPSPSYRQLWRRWRNQTTLFHPDSLALQAEISGLESGYRELTRRIEALPVDPTALWLEQRGKLDALMLRLLALRRELARVSGEPTFLAFHWRWLDRLDYSVEDCGALHRTIEQVVVPVAQKMRRDLSDLPFPEVDDPVGFSDEAERILDRIDPTFGDVFRAMRPDHLDLGQRPGKADTSEQWFFPLAGMPHLHVTSPNLATLLHESGHAVHAYRSFQAQRSLWNFAGPDEFQEFVATTMELLSWPYQEASQGGPYSAAESAAVRQHNLQFYLEVLAYTARGDAFEHWIYGEAAEDVTPAEIDAAWLSFVRRFTPWEDLDVPEEVAATGWQRGNWSLFRMPLYQISYAIAAIGACGLGRRAQTDRAQVIGDYRATLTLGNTLPLPELFGVVGLTFPFTREAVEEAAEFVTVQFSKLPVAQGGG